MNSSNSNLKNELTIEYGGFSKEDLLQKLKESTIMLNEFAEIIFSNKAFKTSKKKKLISIKEISINELGFPNGATIPEIKECLKKFELSECPLEAAPYLRLELLNQEEITASEHQKNKAPLGSLTIFTHPISKDDSFPKGFYLRKMNDQLWLRGYTCSLDFVWNPDDRFIFKCH
ncbi:hypothetical protein [Flavobacterium collinsii]|uniref:Helicase n=1 Tax=Flavobacterium collinsii TaxID=1114861 RepID=A0A9W4XDL0_9FLAO|nr:hypothetical protein [Flavobacterium collinsii]CAI2766231.1 conserved protein of unknown function [Flavobacterium collinsii]